LTKRPDAVTFTVPDKVNRFNGVKRLRIKDILGSRASAVYTIFDNFAFEIVSDFLLGRYYKREYSSLLLPQGREDTADLDRPAAF
jgi:hypothetical protein